MSQITHPGGLTQGVVHVSPRVQAHGGIETMLAYNRELPLRQSFISFFDRHPQARADYHNLNVTWRTPLWVMRQRFRRTMAAHQGSVVVYHNGWGLPLFHDLDGATRRLAFLHADPAYHQEDLPAYAGLLDGAMGCCPGFAPLWSVLLPELSESRRTIYRMPVGSQLPPKASGRRTGRPIVLGYAGRIERLQKCLHLVPGFVRALEARGVDFRFEFVGDGSLTQWLKKRTGERVRFHGWIQSHDDYRRVLATWDGAVYFSDHEGGPIALLESMAAGAVPFYPIRSGSWADYYVPQVDPVCHYPPADMDALAEAVSGIFQRSPTEIDGLRVKARQLVSDHGKEHYKASSCEIINRVAGLPRLSVPRDRRPRISDLLPLGVVSRMAPWALRLA